MLRLAVLALGLTLISVACARPPDPSASDQNPQRIGTGTLTIRLEHPKLTLSGTATCEGMSVSGDLGGVTADLNGPTLGVSTFVSVRENWGGIIHLSVYDASAKPTMIDVGGVVVPAAPRAAYEFGGVADYEPSRVIATFRSDGLGGEVVFSRIRASSTRAQAPQFLRKAWPRVISGTIVWECTKA